MISLILLIVSLVVGFLAFTGFLIGIAAGIAKGVFIILFFLFLVSLVRRSK